MNPRLQVEHPVTECVTGLDLVEWQLRVAAGEPLPLQQQDIQLNGHAIEVRLYTEDPYNGFAPQTGPVHFWRPELALAGRARGQCVFGEVRIDAGIQEGGEISPWYDPMVAKLIAHGRDRNDAIRRLMAALEDSPLLGVRNNARFLRDLLDHADFRAARMHTTTIDQWMQDGEPLLQAPPVDANTWALAAAALVAQSSGALRPDSVAAWSTTLTLQGTTESQTVRIRPHGVQVTVELASGEAFDFEHVALQGHRLCYRQGGVERQALCLLQGRRVTLTLHAAVFVFEIALPTDRPGARPAQTALARGGHGLCHLRGRRRPSQGRPAPFVRRSHEDGNVAQCPRRRHRYRLACSAQRQRRCRQRAGRT